MFCIYDYTDALDSTEQVRCRRNLISATRSSDWSERALDRWITFDLDGYLALKAAEATEVYALIGGVSKITHSHKQASREPVE